jgi:hypothetical protein
VGDGVVVTRAGRLCCWANGCCAGVGGLCAGAAAMCAGDWPPRACAANVCACAVISCARAARLRARAHERCTGAKLPGRPVSRVMPWCGRVIRPAGQAKAGGTRRTRRARRRSGGQKGTKARGHAGTNGTHGPHHRAGRALCGVGGAGGRGSGPFLLHERHSTRRQITRPHLAGEGLLPVPGHPHPAGGDRIIDVDI